MEEAEAQDMILEDAVDLELEDALPKEVIIELLFLIYRIDVIGRNLKITFAKLEKWYSGMLSVQEEL